MAPGNFQTLLSEHVELVTEYMQQHKLRNFSSRLYEQALNDKPEQAQILVRQSPVVVCAAFDKVVDVLQPFGFRYSDLGDIVERGFTPSLWQDFRK